MNRAYGHRRYGNYVRPYYGGYGIYAYNYGGYYYNDGGCGYLYENAVITGSPYWWDRYYACAGYYY